jgi:hypothetical protein
MVEKEIKKCRLTRTKIAFNNLIKKVMKSGSKVFIGRKIGMDVCFKKHLFNKKKTSLVLYSIQYYVIKFVSDLRQVGGFLRVLRFPPPIKLTAMIELKYS